MTKGAGIIANPVEIEFGYEPSAGHFCIKIVPATNTPQSGLVVHQCLSRIRGRMRVPEALTTLPVEDLPGGGYRMVFHRTSPDAPDAPGVDQLETEFTAAVVSALQTGQEAVTSDGEDMVIGLPSPHDPSSRYGKIRPACRPATESKAVFTGTLGGGIRPGLAARVIAASRPGIIMDDGDEQEPLIILPSWERGR